MYALGRCPGVRRSDAGLGNVEGLEDDHQLNCSSNGDDVGAERGVLAVAACSAFGSVPVFDALQLPSLRSFAFGSLGDKEEHQCYEQIEDTTTP